ncbi:MAG TPA: HNH endonuclease signature motif containing protein [Candidatus Udaeobacter sp.]
MSNRARSSRRFKGVRKFVPDSMADADEQYRLQLYNKLVSRTLITATGCWYWLGGKSKAGYGQMGAFGISQYTHIVSYELFIGPVPDGLELDHKCRMPACWNPYHLEPVTHAENLLRGESPYAKKKRQTHCKYGHPFEGENLVFNADGTRDCRICRRRRWRLKEQRERTKQLQKYEQ